MYSNDFEHAFSEFLDRHEYDEAENALFAIVRMAFAAGWQAAGGAPLQSEKIFRLIPGRKEWYGKRPPPAVFFIAKLPKNG